MSFRFLHLADLHLDSAYGGRACTRARLRAATFEALERAASFAISDRLDAVLIAGDAYDDDRLGYDARTILRRELRRLGEASIQVVVATGNHDPGGTTFAAPRLGLDRIPNVHVALTPTQRTVTIERDGAALAHIVACGHADARTTDDLASRMTPVPDGAPSVALLHTQVASARGADGHAPYAPSSPHQLTSAGFAYWALGHVHVRGRAAPEAPAWYCGNLQGRNPRETGPKGGLVVEVDRDGLVREPTFIPFAPVEFLQCELTRAVGDDPESIAAAVADALPSLLATRDAPVGPEEIVLRVALRGPRGQDVGAALEDPPRRATLEEATLEELRALRPEIQLLELELRAGPAVAVGSEAAAAHANALERAPSALREAIRLARALANDAALVDDLDVDWSISTASTAEERRLRAGELARGLAEELLQRTQRSALPGGRGDPR